MSPIRQAELRDLAGIYRVCLQTGDAGMDATGIYRDPDLLGHIYTGPYVVGQPRFAMVLADVRGIGGYALGASDTIAFRRWQEAEWWPSLRRQYLGADRTGADGELIELLFDPPEPDPRLCADYPAHLHIDLAPRARGHGHGRALIEALIDRLCAGSVRGVHLEVAPSNHNAIEFYRHLGFREYSRSDGGIVMVRRLNGLATR